MESYKEKIIDFVSGKTDPKDFCTWMESTPAVFDWLQSLVPQGETTEEIVEEKIDYFLKDLPEAKREEIYAAQQDLSENTDIDRAVKLVNLLNALDTKTAPFTDLMNLLLYNYKTVLENPGEYKASYVQYMCTSVLKFFEDKYRTFQIVPYNVKNLYSRLKKGHGLRAYVNIQCWLHELLTKAYPDECIEQDGSLREKASFMIEVCPEYIEGREIDEAGIIESIIEKVPESLPKGKRKKEIKERIKKEFHVEGTKYPRWIQGGDWPVSKSGKPMRFVEQKRKKGKEYREMLYTIYVFEDVDTLEIRTIDQFT